MKHILKKLSVQFLRYANELFKGLILPGPILLSDKNPWERLSKHPRELCSRGGFDNISQGFLSDSDMGLGRINPDYNISQFLTYV